MMFMSLRNDVCALESLPDDAKHIVISLRHICTAPSGIGSLEDVSGDRNTLDDSNNTKPKVLLFARR